MLSDRCLIPYQSHKIKFVSLLQFFEEFQVLYQRLVESRNLQNENEQAICRHLHHKWHEVFPSLLMVLLEVSFIKENEVFENFD